MQIPISITISIRPWMDMEMERERERDTDTNTRIDLSRFKKTFVIRQCKVDDRQGSLPMYRSQN